MSWKRWNILGVGFKYMKESTPKLFRASRVEKDQICDHPGTFDKRFESISKKSSWDEMCQSRATSPRPMQPYFVHGVESGRKR